MPDAPLVERVLVALLLAASLAGFLVPVRATLRTVLQSNAEPGFRLAPLGPRIRRVIQEVLLQSKVIRERPLPGLAHALIFWGFCAFALATLDHLLAGFGLDLIARQSGFGQVYFGLVAVFAAAVAIAIVGLAVRRFLVKPRWLGKVSAESGFIAFLIFLLMVSYLTEHLGMGPERINWWLHTLALLVFLPLIPHTKHFHLALSPVTIFLARPGFSEIPPLEGDEDFGLDTGADVTWVTALQSFTCVECGRCSEHCPATNTGKELDPKEIILGFRSYLKQHGPGARAALIGEHLTQTAVFQCTTCGACEYQCPVGIQHLPAITGLRRGAVNTGKWEDETGAKLFVNLERHGNPLGISPRERADFINKAGFPIFDGSQEYCLWLGCMGSYDPHGREIAASLAKLLKHLDVSFGVLNKERCTGDAARRLGNDLAFEELATANISAFEESGVRRLLSICPHCVRTISEDWTEFGEAPPIEHHTEFLARERDRLPGGGAGSVVYHDACYLGRYRQVYDEPREIIAHHGELVEAGRSRERSFCCGAGGGLVFLGEEEGKRVSQERTEQLVATGAGTIAIACPFCQTMIRDALPQMENPPRLLDVAQLAAAALPGERD